MALNGAIGTTGTNPLQTLGQDQGLDLSNMSEQELMDFLVRQLLPMIQQAMAQQGQEEAGGPEAAGAPEGGAAPEGQAPESGGMDIMDLISALPPHMQRQLMDQLRQLDPAAGNQLAAAMGVGSGPSLSLAPSTGVTGAFA